MKMLLLRVNSQTIYKQTNSRKSQRPKKMNSLLITKFPMKVKEAIGVSQENFLTQESEWKSLRGISRKHLEARGPLPEQL